MSALDTRPVIRRSIPKGSAPAGAGTLSGHASPVAHNARAAEGTASPQATRQPLPKSEPPAGTSTSHGHTAPEPQSGLAVAAAVPGQPGTDAHGTHAGDAAAQPAARPQPSPMVRSLLADPLLALAADVLDDLEKVRIANENRYRQLTRTGPDADGEERGFGLDQSHPDVARLAALVAMLTAAEHQAELNLARRMRAHPLGPWVKATAGIGEKQGARLLAAIGDPYIRPELTRADGATEPSRPRLVSELWAFCGYHVIRTPVSGQIMPDTHGVSAADGSASGQGGFGTQNQSAGNGTGQAVTGTHVRFAGVAARRKRGEHANWSATAKMRAHLIAVSCMKNLGSPYRPVYDTARAKHAGAVHQVPCPRCGPAGKPAEPGSPLSDGHKHARALRAVAKEILRDLWREARRIHGENTGGAA